MKSGKFIATTIFEYLKENKLEQIQNIGLSMNNKIEGGFLNKKQAADLQKEIESNYDVIAKFGQDSNDIRRSLFNYDNPLLEKDINGVNLRITCGLVEGVPYSGNRRKTYLLYADGKIVGKFYSVDDIKKCIKYIEDNLIKSIPSGTKEYLNENNNFFKYEIIYNHPENIKVVAKHDNIVIGNLSIIDDSNWLGDEDDATYTIMSAFVSEDYRKQGVYINLIKYFLLNNKYGVKFLMSEKDPDWDSQSRSNDADKFWSRIYKNQKKYGVKIDKCENDYEISLR